MKDILLLNFGGPQNSQEVQPFLEKLFSDTDGIRMGMPAFMQTQLAKLIARKRAVKTIEHYNEIGGGSPLVPMTLSLAEKLRKRMPEFRFHIGMSYTDPLIEDTILSLMRQNITEVLVLPLYPHFSIATTHSCLQSVRRVLKEFPQKNLKINPLCSWHNFSSYIALLSSDIQAALHKNKADHILFSAHSIPLSYLKNHDPYKNQIEETVSLVMETIHKNLQISYSLCWQSRVGPVEWIPPDFESELKRLEGKAKNILVVPVSFVSDHIETLHEIDIEYQKIANEMGMTLSRPQSFNDRDEFVEVLFELITKTTPSGCNFQFCRCFLSH